MVRDNHKRNQVDAAIENWNMDKANINEITKGGNNSQEFEHQLHTQVSIESDFVMNDIIHHIETKKQ